MTQRCHWCTSDPLYQHYHDFEWGQVCKDEQRVFEMLCLEGQQAGLSWITVLKKRAAYRRHFFDLPIHDIAALSDATLALKCQDTGLIRHLAKLTAIRDNAIAWCRLKQQGIDLVDWLWQDIQPNCYLLYGSTQPKTAWLQQSVVLSRRLKKHGFKFIGPTTCYAFMQAVGMVNDHDVNCDFSHLRAPWQPLVCQSLR